MLTTPATRKQYLAQQRIQKELLSKLRRIWRGMGGDWTASFNRISADLVAATAESQRDMAAASVAFTSSFLDHVDLPDRPEAEVNVGSFGGFTSSGYPMESLLYGGVVAAREAAATQDLGSRPALQQGYGWLSTVLTGQIADVGRAATGLGITSRSDVNGYTRFLNPPSCPRCAILAGRVYRYSTGFQRHPRCDCIMQPAAGESWAKSEGFIDDPTEAWKNGNVRGLSKGDLKALNEGADLGQIVNASRGMSTTVIGGSRARNIPGTVYNYSPRTGYFKAGTAKPIIRPTPEQIYRTTSSREAALEALRKYRYLL